MLGIVLLILCGATERAAFVDCGRGQRGILLCATRQGGAALVHLFSRTLDHGVASNSISWGWPELPTTVTRNWFRFIVSSVSPVLFKAARSELGAQLIKLSIY